MASVESASEVKASAVATTNTKRPLEDVVNTTSAANIKKNQNAVAELMKAPAAKKAKKTTSSVSDEAKLEKAANGVIRKIQGQINARLKWKNSFKAMKNSDVTKGGRVEVPCPDPAVFEKIFQGHADIKKGKDGKLSCTFKEEDEVSSLPLHGKSYRYNSSELRAPCSATYKDHAITFSFKFCIW
jgi:hypothetical protein